MPPIISIMDRIIDILMKKIINFRILFFIFLFKKINIIVIIIEPIPYTGVHGPNSIPELLWFIIVSNIKPKIELIKKILI